MTEASLRFHIENNDYFGTLATILDLVSQDLNRRGYNPHAATLSRLRDDLVYLQDSHRIEKVTKQKTHNIRGANKVRRSVRLVSTPDLSHAEPRIKLLSSP